MILGRVRFDEEEEFVGVRRSLLILLATVMHVPPFLYQSTVLELEVRAWCPQRGYSRPWRLSPRNAAFCPSCTIYISTPKQEERGCGREEGEEGSHIPRSSTDISLHPQNTTLMDQRMGLANNSHDLIPGTFCAIQTSAFFSP